MPAIRPRPPCSSRPARRLHPLGRLLSCLLLLGLTAVVGSPASAVDHSGGSFQFAGGFNPSNAPYGGFRDRPSGKSTLFYGLRAGFHDQIHCSTVSFHSSCWHTAVFDGHPNVRSQLDVGDGSTAAQLDYDFSDWSPFTVGGGDVDGVGHFRAKNDTGRIQVNFLTTSCTGTGCCSGYGGVCR